MQNVFLIFSVEYYLISINYTYEKLLDGFPPEELIIEKENAFLNHITVVHIIFQDIGLKKIR